MEIVSQLFSLQYRLHSEVLTHRRAQLCRLFLFVHLGVIFTYNNIDCSVRYRLLSLIAADFCHYH